MKKIALTALFLAIKLMVIANTLGSKDTLFLTLNGHEFSFIIKDTTVLVDELSEGTKLETQQLIADTLFQYGSYYQSKPNFDLAVKFYNSALVLQRAIGDESGEAKTLNFYGRIYEWQGENERFLALTRAAYNIQKAIKDSNGLAVSYIAFGDYHRRLGDSNTCLRNYERALDILRVTNDPLRLGFCLYNLGCVYDERGEIDKATDYYFEALEIQEVNGLKEGSINTLIRLGLIQKKHKKFEKSLSYFKSAEAINKEFGSPGVDASIQFNIARLYSEMKNHEESLKSYKQTLALFDTISMGPVVYSLCLHSIGQQYEHLGQLDSALVYYQQSFEMGREVSTVEHTSVRLMDLGKVYFKLGDVRLAKKYLHDGLTLGESIDSPERIKEGSRLLSEVYEKEGNYKQSLAFHKRFILMRDSLRNGEIEQRLLEKEAEYEIEKKAQELLLSERNLILKAKDEKLKNVQMYWMWIGVLSLFLIGILVFLNYSKSKKKQELVLSNTIKDQIQEIEILKSNKLLKLSSDQDGALSLSREINDYLEVPLSNREIEVLVELSKGSSNQEISEALFISVNTVRSHLMKIYEKLNVKNRIQAIKIVGTLQNHKGYGQQK